MDIRSRSVSSPSESLKIVKVPRLSFSKLELFRNPSAQKPLLIFCQRTFELHSTLSSAETESWGTRTVKGQCLLKSSES